MKGTVYIVYIHEPRTTPFQFGTCYALAFIEEENPDGFALVDQHLSSNYGWAWKDIRRDSHMRGFVEIFPHGFDLVDVKEFTHEDHDAVIAALKAKKAEIEQQRTPR